MPARPNVVLILTDDQGWDDLACHGNPYLKTPNLDRLASESVQFDNYYVASVCAPSRASLLTGRHFLRTGVAHVHGGKDFIHKDEVLISNCFSDAGYETAMWGKWHSGKSTGYLPWDRGFNTAYMAQLYKHQDSVGYINGEFVEHQGWTTETLADYACDFIEERANDQKPFFAFIPHLAPHGPLVAEETLTSRFETEFGLSRDLATLYAMVEQVDSSVGRVLDALDEHNLADNTIVLFMSDNGPAANENTFTDEDREIRNVNGYLGHKGNMWERGVKSPLFIRWPDQCKPHRVERLCDICDIMPTLLDCCGIELPDVHLDGRSIKSYLHGDEETLDPKESFIWVSPGWPPDPERGYSIMGVQREYHPISPEDKNAVPAAEQLASIRTEAWKLLRNPGKVPNQPELYDSQALFYLKEDPKEQNNLAETEAQQREELSKRILSWFEEIKQEPHSFCMPEFTIGDNKETSFIAAYGPVRCHGDVSNAGNGLYNWRNVGDGADYTINALQAGTYRVSMHFVRNTDATITLCLESDNNGIRKEITTDGEIVLGDIRLDQGPQQMSLRVIQADESDEAILEKVVMLKFNCL